MNHKEAILSGIRIWAFVFAVSVLIFPLHADERPLFESIMPTALALATTLATVKYFQKNKKSPMIGLCLGLVWLAINITIDSLMFSWGPMRMSLVDYIKDIAVTYLIIPVITTGLGAQKS